MMTLMALSLVIGILIDDAVVVRENIYRHMEHGEDPFTAARKGTAEIGLAVMATTFTILAVFLPVGFMTGIVGQFFKSFALTIAFAVAMSLLVAFTLDPMLSSRFVRYIPPEERMRTRTRPDARGVGPLLRSDRPCLPPGARMGGAPSVEGGRRPRPWCSSRACRRSASSAPSSSRRRIAASSKSSPSLPPGTSFEQSVDVVGAAREAAADRSRKSGRSSRRSASTVMPLKANLEDQDDAEARARARTAGDQGRRARARGAGAADQVDRHRSRVHAGRAHRGAAQRVHARRRHGRAAASERRDRGEDPSGAGRGRR